MECFKYIVLWTITTMVPGPCPDQDTTDKFGRKSFGTTCAVLHVKYEVDSISKSFNDSDSAIKFLNEIKAERESEKERWPFHNTSINNIKLDSILCGQQF